MATFLQLCQAVARESGTVSDLSSPGTVGGQTGRLLRIVNWTRDAYLRIQTRRTDWRWLRADFAGETLAGVRYYASADQRFSHWTVNDPHRAFSIYRTADGPAGEGWLHVLAWDEFRRRCLIGEQQTGQPVLAAIDPQDRLALHPVPDGVFTLRGEFHRGPQTLAADADVPEMPEGHHQAIVWQALVLLGTFDEAFDQIPVWQQFFMDHMNELARTQLPRVTWGDPLA